jgi:hypothetical protein
MPRHRHQPSRSQFPTSEPNIARPEIRMPKPEVSIYGNIMTLKVFLGD